MKNKLFFTALLSLLTTVANAQGFQSVIRELAAPINGVVKVEMDRASTSAMEFRRATSTVAGYRICLFSGTDQNARTRANEAIARLKQIYPEVASKWLYDAPVFKVNCGAWLTRIEATMMLTKLKATFSSAFIISDKIALTELLPSSNVTSTENPVGDDAQAIS